MQRFWSNTVNVATPHQNKMCFQTFANETIISEDFSILNKLHLLWFADFSSFFLLICVSSAYKIINTKHWYSNPTLKMVKKCIKSVLFSVVNENLKHYISKHSMLSYLWLVSSTIMVEIRVELLITLILQFKLPWPSSTYWGWLSIKHRSNWKNNETRDQTKNIKPKQPYILKDLSVISFFDFITTCSTLTCTCISTEHIHTWS